MTSRATRVLRILIMLWARRLNCANTVVYAVAGQAEMVDIAKAQHSGTG